MRRSLARLGLLGGLGLALVPAAAGATSPPHVSVPSAPTQVTATEVCSDVAGFGCSLSVTWSAGVDPGDAAATSFTVTGNASKAPTTLDVSGDVPGAYTVHWQVGRWVPGPDGHPVPLADQGRGEDTAYSVTASNGAGTSAPVTVAVQVIGYMPPPARTIAVTTKNNGARDDVLSFFVRPDQGRKIAVRVNGKPYVLRVKDRPSTITVADTNRARPTIYTVRALGLTQRVVAN